MVTFEPYFFGDKSDENSQKNTRPKRNFKQWKGILSLYITVRTVVCLASRPRLNVGDFFHLTFTDFVGLTRLLVKLIGIRLNYYIK